MVDNRNYEINLYPTTQEGNLDLREKLYYIVGGNIEKLYDSEGNPLTNYNVDLSKRPEVFYLEYQRLGFINERYKIVINYGDNYLALYIDGELVDNIPKSKINSIEDLPNYTWFADNNYTELFDIENLDELNAIGTRTLDEKVTVSYTINYLYENTDIEVENLNSITNEGKVGDVIEIAHPPVLGYVPLTDNPTSYKLIMGTNVVNVYYKVDEMQTFSYTVNYLINNTTTSLSPKLEGTHHVGNVALTHPTVSGYKLVASQPNEILVKAGVANNLNIYYEVDESQNNFPVEVKFTVTDPVTNITKEITKTVTGYVGEEIDINSLFETEDDLKGYKLADSTENKVIVELSQTVTYTLDTTKDDSQWTTITFNLGPNATTTDQVVFEVIKNHPLNGVNQPEIKLPVVTPNYGYKIVETNPWLPEYNPNSEINDAITPVANIVIDTNVTTFKGKVNHQVEGELLPRHIDNLTGYIGQVIDINNQIFTGYKVKASQPDKITILEDDTAAETVLYVVDTEQTFSVTVVFNVTNPVTGIPSQVTTTVLGYIGEDVDVTSLFTTVPELVGYKLADTETVTVEIVSPTTTYAKNTQVDQTVNTFKGKVNHQVEGELLPRYIDNLTGYIGEVINITNQTFTGYKVKASQPDKITILEDDTAVETVLYVVDKEQKLPVTVKFNVTDPVTGIPSQVSTTVSGYIGETVTVIDLFDTEPELVGYKLADAEIATLVIEYPQVTEHVKETQVDQTVKFDGKVLYKVTSEETHRHEETVSGYIGEEVPVPSHSIKGYKVDTANSPSVIKISKDGNAEVTVLYIVDTNVTTFKGKVNHQVEGELTPRHIDNLTGYIGEVINITNQTFIGYKVKASQPDKITILEDDTAVETVLYVVDTLQSIPVYVTFKVLDPITNTLVDVTLQVSGYIGEDVSVVSLFTTAAELAGYKLADTETPTVKIEYPQVSTYIKETQVDQTKTFAYTVNYYMRGTTNSVPGIVANETKSSYVGDKYTFVYPLAPIGYKLVEPTVLSKEVTFENEDKSFIVFYEIDQEANFEILITFIRQDTLEEIVTGPDHGYLFEEILVSKYFNNPGYPKLLGYVAAEGEPATVRINSTAGNTATIYCVVDTTQAFNYTINYYLDGTTNPVPGLARNSDTESGYVGQKKTITFPSAPAGYKLVGAETSREVTFTNKEIVTEVYYQIDVAQKYPYEIKYVRNKGLGDEIVEDTVTGSAPLTTVINLNDYLPAGLLFKEGEPTSLEITSTTANNIVVEVIIDNATNFSHTVKYYLMENGIKTTKLVPGIAENEKVVSGIYTSTHIVTYPDAPAGYKLVNAGATGTYTISNKATTSAIYYEVDNSNVYNGEVTFIVENLGALNRTVTKPVSGSIGEVVDITQFLGNEAHKNLLGFKLKDNEPTSLTITSTDATLNVVTVYLEVDNLQTFTHTVHYYLRGTHTYVPGIVPGTATATGVLGSTHRITFPDAPTDFRLVDSGVTYMDVTLLDIDEIRTPSAVYYERDLLPIVSYKITFYLYLDTTNYIISTREGMVLAGTFYIYNNIIDPGFRIKPNQPTQLDISEDPSDNIVEIDAEIDPTDTFTHTIKYYLKENGIETEKLIPGLTHKVITNVYNYQETVIYPTAPAGYKLSGAVTQETVIITNKETETRVYYEVDKTQKYDLEITFKLEVLGEVAETVIVNTKGYLTEKIDVTKFFNNPDYPDLLGFKLKDISSSPVEILLPNNQPTPNTATIYAIVDDGVNYTHTICYRIKETGALISTKVVQGAIGYSEEVIYPAAPTGYKLEGSVASKVVVIDNHDVTETIYYVVDETQTFPYKFNYIYHLNETTTETFVVEGTAHMNDLVSKVAPLRKGFKLRASETNYYEMVIAGLNKIDIHAEIDTSTTYTHIIIFYLFNTTTPVPGISHNSKQIIGPYNTTGTITYPSAPTGYKLVNPDVQSKEVTITNENVVEYVYYEVDKEQKFDITITFKITVPGEADPRTVVRTSQGYLGEIKDFTPRLTFDPELIGFKLQAGQPTTVTVENTTGTFKTILLEVDSLQEFTYTINYYMKDSTLPVPNLARNLDTITGSVGYSETITYPSAPAGYKPVITSEKERLFTVNNYAQTYDVYYEVDTAQTFKGTITFNLEVTGQATRVVTKEVWGYIGETINFANMFTTESELIGFKPKASEETTITIVSSNSANNVKTINCEVDSLQTFTYTINYYLDGTTNLVPGILRNLDTITGSVGYSETITYPSAPAGYKLVITSEKERLFTVNNYAQTYAVYYEVDTAQKFDAILTFTVLVPGEGTAREIIRTVSGYLGEQVDYTSLLQTDAELKGFKLADPANTYVEIVSTTSNSKTVELVVDSTQTFTHTINYYMNGTNNQVPGILRNLDTVTGSVGYSKTITYPDAPTGYKLVIPSEKEKVVIINNANATTNVYYEVDTNQSLPVNVTFKVLHPVDGLIDVVAQVSGYIGESVSVLDLFNTVSGLKGYKLANGENPNVVIEHPQVSAFVKLTQVDQTKNTFTGKVMYKVTGEETNRHEETVSGYIGEEVDVPTYTISGYKRVADAPTKITILQDNSAEVLVVYEVDTLQTFPYEVNYLLQGSSTVLYPKLASEYHIGTLDLVSHPTIKGYTLVGGQPTTMNIVAVENPNVNKLTIYYVKAETQWVNITFSPGTNAETTDQTVFEVIVNHPLNGLNQPSITLPTITPNLGYKVDETTPWPGYSASGTVNVPTTYTANVVVDETVKFPYKVNYILQGSNPTVLHQALTGEHYIGNLPLTHPTIAGYLEADNQLQSIDIVAVTGTDINEITVYYVENSSEWTTITFSPGANATLTGTLSYNVIKGIALNGPNQPSITAPSINPNNGYKVDPAGSWSPAFSLSNTVNIPTTYHAQVIVDETVKFPYKVNYILQGSNPTVLHEAKTGEHYIGILDLVSHPTIKGYTLVGGQPTTMNIVAVENPNINELTIYYVKNDNEWTTITFSPGANATLTGTLSYNVIKGIALNGPNQPSITVPTINPNTGYKVDPAGSWSPAFSLSNTVSTTTIYNAQVIVDETVKFPYKVNYILQGSNPTVLHQALTGEHYIGNLPLTHPTIAGYLEADNQLQSIDIVAVTGTDINEITVYYVENSSEWTTITFSPGANATLTGTLSYNVIKGIALNGPNQPSITAPSINPNNGYKVDPVGSWSPAFSLSNTVNIPTTYHAQVVMNATSWVMLTFNGGPDTTIDGEPTNIVSYNVLIGIPLNDSRQPVFSVPIFTVNDPTKYCEGTPNNGWFVGTNEFALTDTLTADITYTPIINSRTAVTVVRQVEVAKMISSRNSSRAFIDDEGRLYYAGRDTTYTENLPPYNSRIISTFTQLDPTRINNEVIVDIGMGGYFDNKPNNETGHHIILTETGNVYIWGTNNKGQLGLGDKNSRTTPTLLTTNGLYNGEPIIKVFAGPEHTAFITKNPDTLATSLYTFGRNVNGQLGIGTTTDAVLPQLVSPSTYGNKNIADMFLSLHNTAILTEDGSLYMAGSNYSYQMTDGVTYGGFISTFREVTKVGKIQKVVLGQDHTIVIDLQGYVYGMGQNRFGQLGLPINPVKPNESNKIKLPTPILSGTKAKFVAVGEDQTFVYTENNQLYAMGLNTYEQLGLNNGSTANVDSATLVPASHYGYQVLKSVSSGNDSTAFITVNNDIFTVGRNNYGQLSLGDTIDKASPTKAIQPTIEEVYYAKPTDTIDNGAVHTFTQTLTAALSRTGYTFSIYSYYTYGMTSEVLLSDQVGATNRTIYVLYELAP